MEASPTLAALNVKKLGAVFISHLHLDHTIGLAALMAYHNMNRTGLLICSFRGAPGADLDVYGPGRAAHHQGIGDLVGHLQAAFPKNVDSDAVEARVPIRTHEIAAGVLYRDPAVTVTAFDVTHKTPIAFGFRIQTADRVIVISGDTRPRDTVIDACNGCDLLFHELFGLKFQPTGPKDAAHGHTNTFQGEVTFARDLDIF